MFSFTQLLVIAAAISFVCGADFKVSNSVQDFYLLSQHELLREIELVNTEIAGVESRMLDRVDVLSYQQETLLNKINQVNSSYFPLQALSASRKYCIQKYDSRFVTYDDADKELQICYKKAAGNIPSYTSTAKAKTSTAFNYATTSLNNNVVGCDRKYPTSSSLTSLEACYIDAVTVANAYVEIQLDDARKSLEKGLYDSTMAYQTGVSCSFEVDANVLETIGQNTLVIQECEVCMKSTSTSKQC